MLRERAGGVTRKHKSIEFRRPRSSNGDRGRFVLNPRQSAAGENMKNLFRAVLIVIFGFAFVPAVQTQTVDTEISGHVKDPQGANLPGATVRLFGRDRALSLVRLHANADGDNDLAEGDTGGRDLRVTARFSARGYGQSVGPGGP